MRLTTSQIEQLILALKPWFDERSSGELRLYGSRVHDDLKGGDIDLLLFLDQEETVVQLKQEKHRLLSQIKKQLGDQKIDLLIASKGELAQNKFLKMIFQNLLFCISGNYS